MNHGGKKILVDLFRFLNYLAFQSFDYERTW